MLNNIRRVVSSSISFIIRINGNVIRKATVRIENGSKKIIDKSNIMIKIKIPALILLRNPSFVQDVFIPYSLSLFISKLLRIR